MHRARRIPAPLLRCLAAALSAFLIVATWPVITVHDAHADERNAASAQTHHEADRYGDTDEMHLHACGCTAHCSAFPVDGFDMAFTRPASPSYRLQRAPRSMPPAPPFRPPIG